MADPIIDPARDRPLSFHWRSVDDDWIKRLDLPQPRSTDYGRARAAILTEAVIAARYEGGRSVSYSRRREFYAG
ncbi:MAG: hypothetical protein FJX52_04905 [Alphaproteobacteria bacterium]|nr:hypothetical protein [Alphaproteobacteria bacterium]